MFCFRFFNKDLRLRITLTLWKAVLLINPQFPTVHVRNCRFNSQTLFLTIRTSSERSLCTMSRRYKPPIVVSADRIIILITNGDRLYLDIASALDVIRSGSAYFGNKVVIFAYSVTSKQDFLSLTVFLLDQLAICIEHNLYTNFIGLVHRL
jgi:hypothetical protein